MIIFVVANKQSVDTYSHLLENDSISKGNPRSQCFCHMHHLLQLELDIIRQLSFQKLLNSLKHSHIRVCLAKQIVRIYFGNPYNLTLFFCYKRWNYVPIELDPTISKPVISNLPPIFLINRPYNS